MQQPKTSLVAQLKTKVQPVNHHKVHKEAMDNVQEVSQVKEAVTTVQEVITLMVKEEDIQIEED